jgi:alkylation response protein AidB-like acyl-CoA dehydrogenase
VEIGQSRRRTDWAERTAAEMATFGDQHREEFREATRLGCFPRELYLEMGERGWVGPITPVEEGGLGGGVAEYCLIEEQVARHAMVSPQISIQGQCWLLAWGTEEQRARYLSGIAQGKLIFSESISEPGIGSSLKAMKSTARQDGDDWLIRGAKTHVNLGHQSDVTIVYAMTEHGLTSFLVDMSEPGVSSKQTDPIGLRMIPTADMFFEDVRVPSSALLGRVGGGMDTFLSTFNTSRLGNASELIGMARRALVEGLDYASTRSVQDSVVTDFQGIQWTAADCFSALHGAILARNYAVALADQGADHSLETTLAKKLAIDAAEHAVNEVFALVGSYGLYTNTDFAQLLHDVKVLRVAGGSLEILRNYIARRVLRSESYEGLR